MLTYQDTGVDPSKNDVLVKRIRQLTNIDTGFAATNPVGNHGLELIQCTDGTGSKIQLASEYPQLYDTIGQDLVAMCVNDLICTGARPMFFQDYIGMNNLEEHIVMRIVESIYNACVSCNVKLTGGEMAEMPGTYSSVIPELVGFATGLNNAEQKIQKSNVRKGDLIIGLESAGPHSNGYTLIRRVMVNNKLSEETIKSILAPTIIYNGVTEYLETQLADVVHSIAHITGGGLESNIKRAIPDDMIVHVEHNWKIPNVYKELQWIGNISNESMWETFNMGIGMVLIVPSYCTDIIVKDLYRYNPITIGEIL